MKFINITLCVLFFFTYSLLLSHTLKQKSNDLLELLSQATETQQRIISILKKFKNGIDVIDPGIKGIETINRLLQTRWNGNPSYITDYSRATIVTEDFIGIYRCLQEMDTSDLHIILIQDNYAHPYPELYRDINIVFEDIYNGHLGEIQINSKQMVKFKNEFGHHLFDRIRKINAKAVMEKRKLTNKEDILIKGYTKMSEDGYNTAFELSLLEGEKKLRIGVYGICIHDSKILMVRTQSGSKEIFNFPGGGVEEGEGFATTLIRECQEELGTNVKIGNIFYTSEKKYMHDDFPDNESFHLYYTITLDGIVNPEIHGARWFSINDLPIEQMLPIDLEIVKKLSLKI